jgi:hypothetical protein
MEPLEAFLKCLRRIWEYFEESWQLWFCEHLNNIIIKKNYNYCYFNELIQLDSEDSTLAVTLTAPASPQTDEAPSHSRCCISEWLLLTKLQPRCARHCLSLPQTPGF